MLTKKYRPLTLMLISLLFGSLLGLLSFYGLRSPDVYSLSLFTIIPLMIFLSALSKTTLFEKIKFATILLGNTLLLLIGMNILPVVLFVWLLLYRINIIEAAIFAYKKKKFYIVIGSIAMLIGTLNMHAFWDQSTMHANAPGMSLLILAYIIWNSNFVLGEFGSELAVYHLGVQFAAVLAAFLANDAGVWLTARSYSLIIGGALHVKFHRVIQDAFHIRPFQRFTKAIETTLGQRVLLGIVIFLNATTFFLT